MSARKHIAVIGGGASGVLFSAALLATNETVAVTIIEPRDTLGRGMAYSTAFPEHLLNVPARGMSAFADNASHFLHWLEERFGDRFRSDSFVPRMIYGDYLDDVMATASRRAGDRFKHVRDRAVALSLTPNGVSIAMSGGEFAADAVVLAFGNATPAPWAGLDGVARDTRVFSSAWEPGALQPSSPDETVLLLGTGLTAVDAVLGLRHNGHRGVIHMISRRGLLPHEHRFFDTPPAADPNAETMNDLFAAVRHAMGEAERTSNWRASVDRIRPRTNQLWQAMTIDDQRRFVRHALPYWNVHRHRMAPEIAQTISELMATGRLQMIAGRTTLIKRSEGGISVGVRPRGSSESMTLSVERLINCSGPQHDIRRLANPLVANMLAKGLLMPHSLRIGAEVAADGALYDASEKPSDRLFAIGPVRFGTLIETTAIPEIRQQAKELAFVLGCGELDQTAAASALAR